MRVEGKWDLQDGLDVKDLIRKVCRSKSNSNLCFKMLNRKMSNAGKLKSANKRVKVRSLKEMSICRVVGGKWEEKTSKWN